MSLFARLRYALYLTAVNGAAIGLFVMLASADVIGLLPRSAPDALSNPFFVLTVFVLSLVISPWVAERLPLPGDEPAQKPGGKPPFGYLMRAAALIALGAVLVILVNLVIYLLGKFA